jgi:hypothetical protein
VKLRYWQEGEKAMTMKQEPWELARREGKTIICRLVGPMVAVYYPYRKSGDLYVAGPRELVNENTVFCAQCNETIPAVKFIDHVNKHNRYLKKFPHFIIDKSLIQPPEEKKDESLSTPPGEAPTAVEIKQGPEIA